MRQCLQNAHLLKLLKKFSLNPIHGIKFLTYQVFHIVFNLCEKHVESLTVISSLRGGFNIHTKSGQDCLLGSDWAIFSMPSS